MAKYTKKRIVEMVKDRVETIERLSRHIPDKYPIGVVEWFGREIKGPLNGLLFDSIQHPADGGSARVDIRGQTHESGATLLLSELMLSMFINLANECYLDEGELYATIDNFLIHEIVHRCQGMGEQEHRGLSLLAPNILHENDYEADASAILIQYHLKLLELQERGELRNVMFLLWKTYAELIKSTIFQIHLFTLYDEKQKKIINNEGARSTIVSFNRWERMCIWHFQYHRSLVFNSALSLGDFQILFRPAISLRNQYIASNEYLNSLWPKREWTVVPEDRMEITKGLDMFCLSSINRWGLRQHARWNPRAQDQVESLFLGIFTADTTLSESFFRPLFNEKKFLVGDLTLDPNGTGPDGGTPKHALDLLTKALKGDAVDMARATSQIFKPTRHQGVVAEQYSKAIKIAVDSLNEGGESEDNKDEDTTTL